MKIVRRFTKKNLRDGQTKNGTDKSVAISTSSILLFFIKSEVAYFSGSFADVCFPSNSFAFLSRSARFLSKLSMSFSASRFLEPPNSYLTLHVGHKPLSLGRCWEQMLCPFLHWWTGIWHMSRQTAHSKRSSRISSPSDIFVIGGAIATIKRKIEIYINLGKCMLNLIDFFAKEIAQLII